MSRDDAGYRLGVIGLGWLGTDLALQAQEHEDVTVAAIADVDVEARARAGERLYVPRGSRYENHEEMFAAETLDAVVVATPHAFHYEQILDALAANLHILCEKPLCVGLERAKRLEREIRASDRTFVLGYQRHLNRPFQVARRTLAEQEAEIEYVRASVTQPWTEFADGTWRTDAELSGGGVLYDTGNHLVDGVLWSTGLVPTHVSAEMEFRDGTDVDLAAAVSVTFENGAVGSFSVDGRAPQYSGEIAVWSGDGAVRYDEDEVRTVDPEGNEFRPNADRGAERNKIEAFVDAMAGERDPPATVRDGVLAVALTEAAYESARAGRRVEIDLGGEGKAGASAELADGRDENLSVD